MDITLYKSSTNKSSSVNITGSKSESNRLLLLQALYPNIHIKNLSNSDDSVLMQKALNSKNNIIDVHHAGTAMRFLTAYFSIQKDTEITLTGSSRMKERPIKILVNALRSLGAEITYLENEGFPPLKIKGTKLIKNEVSLDANVSSQYISALLLIASKLENGLKLNLKGKITSIPYINMTLSLLNQIEVTTDFKNNTISVQPSKGEAKTQSLTVESDWSSASYFYSIAALSDLGTEIQLASYKKDSLQGDSVLSEIYKQFGVKTTYNKHTLTLEKSAKTSKNTTIDLDLSSAPDIAQTIAVTAFGLGLECKLTGLHTLKIKETDRLVALKTELEKLGAQVDITLDTLQLKPSNKIKNKRVIETYNDHRMAMAFAPLALKTEITVKDANVVSKSYPQFWEDLKAIGFNLK